MTGGFRISESKVEVRLIIEHATADDMLAALLVDDFSGLGVQVRSTAERGKLTYMLTSSCESIYRAKSVANELLRLTRMLLETHALLEACASNRWSARKE